MLLIGQERLPRCLWRAREQLPQTCDEVRDSRPQHTAARNVDDFVIAIARVQADSRTRCDHELGARPVSARGLGTGGLGDCDRGKLAVRSERAYHARLLESELGAVALAHERTARTAVRMLAFEHRVVAGLLLGELDDEARSRLDIR